MLRHFEASTEETGDDEFLVYANWMQEEHPRTATWTCTGKDARDDLEDRLRAHAQAVDSLEALEDAVGQRADMYDGKPRA